MPELERKIFALLRLEPEEIRERLERLEKQAAEDDRRKIGRVREFLRDLRDDDIYMDLPDMKVYIRKILREN